MVDTSNDNDPRNSDLDHKVRSALDAPATTVSRVVNAALRDGAIAAAPGSSNRRRVLGLPRPAFAVVVGLVMVCAGLLVLAWPRPQPPAPTARAVITNEGDIMVIKAPGRPITLIAPGSDMTVPSGTVSIVLLGESR